MISHHRWPKALLGLLICQLILISCKGPVAPRTLMEPTIPPTPEPTGTPGILPSSTPEPIPSPASTLTTPVISALEMLIPKPVSATAAGGQFLLSNETRIYLAPDSPELAGIGQYLAGHLKPATGFALPVQAAGENVPAGSIVLRLDDGDVALGDEGYTLEVKPDGVTLSAYRAAGLFYGGQTLRQLLPAAVESAELQPGPWAIPTGTIRDYPRYTWRGVMLDVARHFFSVQDVERFIDLAAYYKLNRFHLHLTDDQGWRLMINSWPELAKKGGRTAVDYDPGGYYTQAEYSEIVTYAQQRYIMIVPEIDTPGHTNAALASYADLNCSGKAPDLYGGTKVGFSSLCIGKDITYKFMDDVIGEIAALTPGDYIHIGGDEAQSTPLEEYKVFVERVQEIVKKHGKHMMGWEEIAQADGLSGALVQIWNEKYVHCAGMECQKVVLSPSRRIYLDMMYTPATPLGQDWAALVEVKDAYDWDPATEASYVTPEAIIGVEAPLWTETLRIFRDIEFMAFPRLPGVAEIGWSPKDGRSWEEYRVRLGVHGARMAAMGINFYRSPQVPWVK